MGHIKEKDVYTTCLISTLCVCIRMDKMVVYCYALYYFLQYQLKPKLNIDKYTWLLC